MSIASPKDKLEISRLENSIARDLQLNRTHNRLFSMDERKLAWLQQNSPTIPEKTHADIVSLKKLYEQFPDVPRSTKIAHIIKEYSLESKKPKPSSP